MLRYLWFQEHKWFKPVIVGLFFLLVVGVIIAVIKSGWNGLPTWISGIALGFFAWLTYRHSKQVAEMQLLPVLQLYSKNEPETGGPFETGVTGGIEYYGVRWTVYLWNPAGIQVMANRLEIDIITASGNPIPINKFCDVYDEKNYLFSKQDEPIVVSQNSYRILTIIVWNNELKERLNEEFGAQNRFKLRFMLYQRRKFNGQDKSGWVDITSEPFSLPEKFTDKTVVISYRGM